MRLYTIGHSNYSIDEFIQLLESHSITQLVDVRSRPYSRFYPHFNNNALQQALADHGIQYIYSGESLGGRPKDPLCYKHHAIPDKGADYLHEVDYPEVMKRPWFLEGIQQLLKSADLQTTCMMCSEKDPALCHRHHLIAKFLLQMHADVLVLHIMADGQLIDARNIHPIPDRNY